MTKFAFILHPLDITDITRKYTVARYLPDAWVEAVLPLVPPRTVSEITGIESPTGARTTGWFIGCMRTARQLLHHDPQKILPHLIDCCRKAEEKGAEIIGLGAYTAVVGDAGVTLARNVDIGVTTGNSYTVATAVEGLLQAAELTGHNAAESTVAVLGATGSIGRVCAMLLADKVGRIIMVGRREEALERIADEIEGSAEIETSTDIPSALRKAPLVLTVTSALEAVVPAGDLLPGAVVCDVARPRDVSKEVAQKRADVLVIEGGVVAVPGDVDFHFDFGFPPQTAYACMAETMILALEGWTDDYTLGRELEVER
ncbi:MAG: shikimate dehydrogenase, partial [Armatimonadota bacterium]